MFMEEILGRSVGLMIDGTWQAPTGEGELTVINPANGAQVARVPAGSAADADRAVVSARGSHNDGRWSNASASHRKAILHRLADLIVRDASLFDLIDAVEMGKPISVQRFNADSAADHMRFYAEAADKLNGDVIPTDGSSLYMLRWTSRGVVAAITPWNFPTFNAVMKVAPALAAGNSVVLKPSELSNLSAIHLADLALEAGVPPGVLNIITGKGEIVGRALAIHDDVDMLAFTGSTQVGGLMQQFAGASNMKAVQAECGGKSPQIVFDDGVDLEATADSISAFLLTNQGQVCSAGTRLLVQRALQDRLQDMLRQRFSQIRPGDPTDPDVTYGPLASRQHFQRVLSHIDNARATGASVITGGSRILSKSGGNFLAPTILGDVRPESAVSQEEIFGPILAVTPFDTVDEAIRLANCTQYGLSSYAWTASVSTAMQLAQGIRSSVVIRHGVSCGTGPGHAWTTEPFGMSGIGAEGGLVGLQGYMRRQAVSFFY